MITDEEVAALKRLAEATKYVGFHKDGGGISVINPTAILALIERASGQGDAVDEIRAERRRQIDVEGWTLAHDDNHDQGALPAAAASYALCVAAGAAHPNTGWPREYFEAARRVFPFDQEDWFKPKDARRDLIRAGALIVAEIERLDRAAIRNADKERKT